MESETQKAVNQNDELSAAISDPMIQLSQIVPLMIRKHEAGKEYYNKINTEADKRNYLGLVQYYNDLIKKVMGLI